MLSGYGGIGNAKRALLGTSDGAAGPVEDNPAIGFAFSKGHHGILFGGHFTCEWHGMNVFPNARDSGPKRYVTPVWLGPKFSDTRRPDDNTRHRIA
ncbi:MAG: hypothetical protein AMXMBFR84_28270 [Candidatus Hydrogenedentota bacterium]